MTMMDGWDGQRISHFKYGRLWLPRPTVPYRSLTISQLTIEKPTFIITGTKSTGVRDSFKRLN